MFKKYRILKWISLFLGSLIVVIVTFGFWFRSLIPPSDVTIESTTIEDWTYDHGFFSGQKAHIPLASLLKVFPDIITLSKKVLKQEGKVKCNG